MREGANAAQTRRNFEDRPILYVPLVHWEWTRRHVLVMERIHGIPISDIAALKARGVNFRFLAERGVEIFFTQVFRHNFFHADMHAGNIFVDTRDPQRPGYLAVDFGIVGTLGREDQRYIAHNIYAFFNGDYRRVAELHVASGWVRPDTCVEDLESVIRTLCEPILFRPFKDIHLDQLLLRLFEIARRFDMEVQPQLVLLQKTLVQIEGLGRQLYPDLDLWSTAKPFMERWLLRQRLLPGRELGNGLQGMVEGERQQRQALGEIGQAFLEFAVDAAGTELLAPCRCCRSPSTMPCRPLPSSLPGKRRCRNSYIVSNSGCPAGAAAPGPDSAVHSCYSPASSAAWPGAHTRSQALRPC